MMKFLLPIIGSMLAGLSACNTIPDVAQNKLVQHTANDRFSVDLPEYMYETSDINPFATLAYGNHPEEIFLMVIDDQISDLQVQNPDYDLSNYMRYAISFFDDSTENPPAASEINGAKAYTYTSNGTINNHPVYYIIAVVEGREHFYRIVGWTTEENQTKYKDDLLQMIQSFKEINAAT